MFTSEIIGVLASLFASVGLPNAEQCGNHELIFSSECGSSVKIAIEDDTVCYSVDSSPDSPCRNYVERELGKWGQKACEVVETFNGIQK